MTYRRTTPDELIDRLEINDLLTRYTQAIDEQNWDLLDTVFVPDAKVDYTSSGGIAGTYPEARKWLSEVLPMFSATAHYISNSRVELDGDSARAVTAVYNPMFMRMPDGSEHTFTVGAYYHDDLVRTSEGWRIATRREEQAFMQGSLPGTKEG
jgi:3-phenylpropionate/cinnamic acid dioxygenase small subunit